MHTQPIATPATPHMLGRFLSGAALMELRVERFPRARSGAAFPHSTASPKISTSCARAELFTRTSFRCGESSFGACARHTLKLGLLPQTTDGRADSDGPGGAAVWGYGGYRERGEYTRNRTERSARRRVAGTVDSWGCMCPGSKGLAPHAPWRRTCSPSLGALPPPSGAWHGIPSIWTARSSSHSGRRPTTPPPPSKLHPPNALPRRT